MQKHFFPHLLLSLSVTSFSVYLDIRIYKLHNPWIYICTALVTFWVYSLDYIRDTNGRQDKSIWGFLALFSLSLVGLIISTGSVLSALTFLLFFGVFSLYAYPIPFLKKKEGGTGLKIKAIKGLKSFIITVGYLFFLNFTLLSLGYKDLSHITTQNFIFGNGFLAALIFVNTNFGDLRDVDGDREEGTKTLGTILGKRGLTFFLWLCSVILFFMSTNLFELGFAVAFSFYGFFAFALFFFYQKLPRWTYSILDLFLFLPLFAEIVS